MSVFPSTHAAHFLVKVTPLQNKFHLNLVAITKNPQLFFEKSFSILNEIIYYEKITAMTPDGPVIKQTIVVQRNRLDLDHPVTLDVMVLSVECPHEAILLIL